jgi:SNF2 family DNA or RNA helicase
MIVDIYSYLTRGVKRISLLNIAMQLRKVCLHPYLLEGVEATEAKDCRGAASVMERLVQMSGKFVLLDKLLPKLQAEGHRVLIFSQMVRLLDILQDYMAFRKYKFERIDGLSKAADRQAAIDS